MLNKRHILAAALAAMLSFGTTASAFAGERLATNEVTLVAQSSVSASEAKAIARAQVPGGKVVDINRRGDTYRVRVIARDGRVVDVYIDANTGRVKR